jgi:3-dehydroquinate synthase
LNRISVRVAPRRERYTIYIENGLLDRFADFVSRRQFGKRYAIITDSNVLPLYGEKLKDSLVSSGIDAAIFEMHAGETFKTNETKVGLDMRLLDSRFGRDSAVIALGGGVVGDVAGFVASTYMRGIPCIQVPTTVVAQADSSIGGKTAVDYPQGKNLVGAFHHPVAVFIDPSTLVTLDERNYRSGLVEVLKHGLIRDARFFEYFISHIDAIVSREHPDYPETMSALMTCNSKIKKEIVALDPREKNLRKVLNYGHTIGHAVEHISGYSLLHGEAVAIGIACEAFFSKELGFLSESDRARQTLLIEKLGLPVRIPGEIETESIIETMYSDKKASGKLVHFVLLSGIGSVKKAPGGSFSHALPPERIRELVEKFRACT